ncbi:MAG: arylsulfatase, partial [Planctomycetota bacterium]
MTDDQGYWDTGVTGHPHLNTPNIDQLAADGAQLMQYYAAPVCAPTRAGIMTGRHYLRTGVYNTRFGGDTLGESETTIASILSDAGYRTGLFGKWHLGQHPGFRPTERGFDEFFGHYHGHIERYQHPDQIYHNEEPVKARGYVTDLFTDAAIDFIDNARQDSSQPFLCMLMYNAPHSPFVMDTSHADLSQGDKTIEHYLDRGMPFREARIAAMIERIDRNLGRLFNQLAEWSLENETVVVLTSDNGGVSKFFKAGLRGQKASVFEGGVRAPCFVRWPGKIPAGRKVNGLAWHVDWFSTFCEIAGADLPQDRPTDGRSILSALTGDQTDIDREFVCHTWDRYVPNPDRRWAIHSGKWKLLCNGGTSQNPTRKDWLLFDLDKDPSEKTNLASQHEGIVKDLRVKFTSWFK